MEGMNPRGFFFINASFIYHPPFLLVQPYIICFDYEYLVQCSMITTHHSCTSIFPICKLHFITFPQNLDALKKNVILVNDNLQDTNKLYKQTFMFIPFVQHISCMISVCLFLLFFLLVKNSQKATRFSKTEYMWSSQQYACWNWKKKTPIKFLLRTKSITIKQMGIWVFWCMIVAWWWQCWGCQVCISTEILQPCNCFLLHLAA
jgi:hypothetical protein